MSVTLADPAAGLPVRRGTDSRWRTWRFAAAQANSPTRKSGLPSDSPLLFQKSFKKCIDTENQNLVSRAPGSETDEGFYPVGSLSVRILITTKTNETPGEKEHTKIHVFTQSTQNVSFMRTRSGSLAAVTARVPSHPANFGVLCVFTENASGSAS
jgi:hypothetical protein